MQRPGLDIIVEVRGNLWKVERDSGKVYLWDSRWGEWDGEAPSTPEKVEAANAAIAHYTAIVEDPETHKTCI